MRSSQRDRKPALTAEDKEDIRQCMDEKPDITTEEIREKLSHFVSCSTVERGYTLKKKPLCASERDRIRCAGEAQRTEKDDTT